MPNFFNFPKFSFTLKTKKNKGFLRGSLCECMKQHYYFI